VRRKTEREARGMSFERRRLKTCNMRNNFPVKFSDREIIARSYRDARVKGERDPRIPSIVSRLRFCLL